MLLAQKMLAEAKNERICCDGDVASANMRSELPKQRRIFCLT